MWNGPIGLAEFVVAPRSAPWGLRWPAECRFGGFEEQDGEGASGRVVRYRFEVRDWTPWQDFIVTLYDWPAQLIFEELIVTRRVTEDDAMTLSRPLRAAARFGVPRRARRRHARAVPQPALCAPRLPLPPDRPARGPVSGLRHHDRAGAAGTTPADPPRRDSLRLGAPNPFYSDALLDDQDRAYLAGIAAAQGRRQGAVVSAR